MKLKTKHHRMISLTKNTFVNQKKVFLEKISEIFFQIASKYLVR